MVFVTVPFAYGVIIVVIEVRLTTRWVVNMVVAGHHSSVTVSWITKQQADGVGPVKFLVDLVVDESVDDVLDDNMWKLADELVDDSTDVDIVLFGKDIEAEYGLARTAQDKNISSSRVYI